ncbi:unnamed protein product [Symbiodinium natans]|uniref:Uncharacterized protein n=1 Tax=Symbiodinium natans TaxID=878477 RepID=A0A812ULG3_9DINO|nr:unnamed protein product [Symbiodinium natans]
MGNCCDAPSGQEEGEEIDLGELESATPPKPAITLEWLYEPGEVKVLYYGDMEEYKKIPRVPQAWEVATTISVASPRNFSPAQAMQVDDSIDGTESRPNEASAGASSARAPAALPVLLGRLNKDEEAQLLQMRVQAVRVARQSMREKDQAAAGKAPPKDKAPKAKACTYNLLKQTEQLEQNKTGQDGRCERPRGRQLLAASAVTSREPRRISRCRSEPARASAKVAC